MLIPPGERNCEEKEGLKAKKLKVYYFSRIVGDKNEHFSSVGRDAPKSIACLYQTWREHTVFFILGEPCVRGVQMPKAAGSIMTAVLFTFGIISGVNQIGGDN